MTPAERTQVAEQVRATRSKYLDQFDCCPPEPRFTLEDAETAGDWRFNCGPASICAVASMTPDELRPKLLDFERKGYTNPTLMWDVLRGLGMRWLTLTASWDNLTGHGADSAIGLMRVQWGGPWTKDGVPMAARYRHTHWVAWWRFDGTVFIFDVNAMCAGGWLPIADWRGQLAPWLIRACEPKGDGTFWPTHIVKTGYYQFPQVVSL